MNKADKLLFRGQGLDLDPMPTLLRDQWCPPRSHEVLSLDADRPHYWRQLSVASELVASALDGQLPRHAPFEQYRVRPELRVAPWAVVQHYALWPTPLLDLTTSLRAAASFAFGLEADADAGFLYAFAIDRTAGDIMKELDPMTEDVVLRLSAVCPPKTARPHLQDGYLAGNPNFDFSDITERTPSPLADRFIAKFKLVDLGPNAPFWDADFPKHSKSSLLPNEPVEEKLITIMNYRIVDGRLAIGR
jgi:hypothetical protein